jgi:serine/threonine protein kinase
MAAGEPQPLESDPFELGGRVIEGKYRVSRLVAEGGFGFVYLGHQLVLDVPIAIKVLKWSSSESNRAAQAESFTREAQTVARLRHPAIVQALDAGISTLPVSGGRSEDIAWIVLEWLDGQTLKANLAQRRGASGRTPAEALAVLGPVLEAVHYAHARGVVHRDLKPGNIMLVPAENGVSVRVLDFGIAKAAEAEPLPETGQTLTEGGRHAFSRHYAAPEQLAGARTGPWTDIHALGLLLVELLTDRSPYPSRDATELYRAAFAEERPSPARYGLDVGPWQAIIERAVALKPAQRFASVHELHAALLASLGDATAAAQHQAERPRPAAVEAPEHLALESGTASLTLSTGIRAEPPARPRRAVRLALLVSIGALLGGVTLLRPRAPAHVRASMTLTSAAPVKAGALPPPSLAEANGSRPPPGITPSPVSASRPAESISSAALQRAARKPKPAPAASAAPSAAPPPLPPYNLE